MASLALFFAILATVIAVNCDIETKQHADNRINTKEHEISHWRDQAHESIREKMRERRIEGVAKNLILFLGDGMSIPTVTAARIYLGQLNNRSGEESKLSFEQFPFTGLAKTYCVDKQVADSACTATAYLGGVKANFGTLGVTAAVPRGDCEKSADPRNHVDTILDWAQAAGKATGLVTTTRITHASPAGHFTHSGERDWESDHAMLTHKNFPSDPRTCQDIARQLVYNQPGKNIKVLLGGGRKMFVPNSSLTSTSWTEGVRQDGLDLISEWRKDKESRGKEVFVQDRQELLAVDIDSTDYLLGLFQPNHMLYHLEEGSDKQPSLAEMTETAIRLLSKERQGFYLFVEGGKIDLGHHYNWAMRALDETVEFHKAIQVALDMVDIEDTLIVVTADHSHTMTMSGYSSRGNDILGLTGDIADDGLPTTSLSYANGPSGQVSRSGLRRNLTLDDFHNHTYKYPSLVNLEAETHGGDDVAVYARGPWAHLLVGIYEQNLVPHVMAYAADIGPIQRMSSTASVLSLPATLSLSTVALFHCFLKNIIVHHFD